MKYRSVPECLREQGRITGIPSFAVTTVLSHASSGTLFAQASTRFRMASSS